MAGEDRDPYEHLFHWDDDEAHERRILLDLEADVREVERLVERVEAIEDRDAFLRGTSGARFLRDIELVLQQLEENEITQLLTGTEAAPLALDNLPVVLEDAAGTATLRSSLRLAIRVIQEEVERLGPDAPTKSGAEAKAFEISVDEHRHLEVVVLAVVQASEATRLDPSDRELLQTAIETLQLQLRTSQPDRTIIGRALRRIAVVSAGLAGGVAANYLTDLIRRFHVPWP